MASTGDHMATDSQLPLSSARRSVGNRSDMDAWASSVVAAAVKIAWAMPVTTTTSDIRRRIARAEALRIGRKLRKAEAPVPEGMAPSASATVSED